MCFRINQGVVLETAGVVVVLAVQVQDGVLDLVVVTAATVEAVLVRHTRAEVLIADAEAHHRDVLVAGVHAASVADGVTEG